jgi:membrane-bound serine protease (ClpP class)
LALVAGFILFALIDPPLGVVFLAGGAVLEVGEAALWYRYLKRIRIRTGAESYPGRRAEVIEECNPRGRVKIDGEIWNAESESRAAVGETVEVIEVDRLTLRVRPPA